MYVSYMIMESFILLLALPIFLSLLYFQKWKNSSRQKLKPPGPRGLPLIGILHQFDVQSPHTYLYHLSKKYGPVMSFKLGYRSVVVISSASIVREIMKFHDLAFSGRPMFLSQILLSYGNLNIGFSTYSDSWLEMRKLWTLKLFSPKQLQYFRPIREQEVSLMIKKIANDASLSKITNLSKVSVSLSSNLTCLMALGKRYSEEDGGRNPYSNLIHDIQVLLGGFFVGDYLPLLGWIDRVSGKSGWLQKTFKGLDRLYEEIIEEHLDLNKPKSMQGDLVDLLLEMNMEGSSTSMDITMDHIKSMIMDILAAGTDTISSAAVFAMTALMKNPLCMKKVQTEIREHVGNKDFINEDDIVNLRYFKAIVKESFRLYPPAPLLVPRETIENCMIHGYEIEKGTMVYINAWGIARDPECWKDPETFIPERFLESDIDIRGRDPSVIPFGIGRRGCVAQTTGLAVVELELANLLYMFDWELPPGVTIADLDFETLPGLTMQKKTPLCLMAKRACV